MIAKLSNPEDQAIATGYIDRLRAGDFDAIEKSMDPSLKSTNLHETLVKMANLIPPGPPISQKVVGLQASRWSNSGASKAVVNTTFEFQYPGRWLLVNVDVQDKDGVKTIIGFHVYTEPDSLEVRNRFSLSGKTPLQYAVLAAAVLTVLLTLYALVVCVRTPLKRRKWIWIIFILVGFGTFAVDWTSGQWGISLLTVRLFSVSALASSKYGAWIISVSAPVGAIVFLIKRRKLMEAGPAVAEVPAG
jgi:hypothetical protein